MKKEIEQYIKINNFVASKKMGQNFLINKDIQKKIVEAANIDDNTLVIEIGPGLGAITNIILKTSYLIAIELDKRLYNHLLETYSSNKKFHIINNDFLEIDIDKIIENNHFNIKFHKIVVIANLPYSISSLILNKLCQSKLVNYAVLMVQKEMAMRVSAKVNSTNYNAFTVFLQHFANIKFLFDVGPKNFLPEPKVISSVIMVQFNKQNYDYNFVSEFKKFLNVCFCSKRKTIYNNLKTKYDTNTINKILIDLNLDKLTRPQNISIDKFLNMFFKLKE